MAQIFLAAILYEIGMACRWLTLMSSRISEIQLSALESPKDSRASFYSWLRVQLGNARARIVSIASQTWHQSKAQQTLRQHQGVNAFKRQTVQLKKTKLQRLQITQYTH